MEVIYKVSPFSHIDDPISLMIADPQNEAVMVKRVFGDSHRGTHVVIQWQ